MKVGFVGRFLTTFCSTLRPSSDRLVQMKDQWAEGGLPACAVRDRWFRGPGAVAVNIPCTR